MRALVVRTGVAFALGLGSLACGGATKSFKSDGYYHEDFPYRVVGSANVPNSILGDDWQLDNYQRDKRGALINRKKGARYESQLRFDVNDDGEMDEQLSYPRYDLLFVHRNSDAEIWLSSLPLSGNAAEKDLRVLLDRYVEGISGTGSVVVVSISEHEKTAVADKRYATRITDVQKALVDGVEAVVATVEVANVDQLQLSPDSRWARSKIVLVRPGFRYALGPSSDGTASHSWPLLFVAGYSNNTSDFGKHLGDFERFLSGIDFLTDEEVLFTKSNSILDCAGQATLQLDLQINGTGSVTKVGPSGPACLRRLLTGLKFGALGKPRTLKTTVTRNQASSRPKGYQALEASPTSDPPKPPLPEHAATPSDDPKEDKLTDLPQGTKS